jgi:hypothetical protein
MCNGETGEGRVVRTEHQPGVAARGVALAALLVMASIVALLTASGLMDQLRSIASAPSSASGPSAAAAYEPR